MKTTNENDARNNTSPDRLILSRISAQSSLFDVEHVTMQRGEYTNYVVVAYGEHVEISGCELCDACGARNCTRCKAR